MKTTLNVRSEEVVNWYCGLDYIEFEISQGYIDEHSGLNICYNIICVAALVFKDLVRNGDFKVTLEYEYSAFNEPVSRARVLSVESWIKEEPIEFLLDGAL